MRTTRTLGVIPARLGAERLPRKPLYELAGRPLIEWVWRRVQGLGVLDAVVVATDSEEVLGTCRGFGADVVMTSAAHRSGTERAAEVAALEGYRDCGIVVNVQGDEPFVSRAQLERAIGLVSAGWDVGTVAAPLGTLEALVDPSVVKVVRGDDGGALYFSRAAIPHRRDGAPSPGELASEAYLGHIGVYAYARDALARWVALPEDRLERLERLEQLRALRHGLRIGVAVVAATERGVDTVEDARRVAARLSTMDWTQTDGG